MLLSAFTFVDGKFEKPPVPTEAAELLGKFLQLACSAASVRKHIAKMNDMKKPMPVDHPEKLAQSEDSLKSVDKEMGEDIKLCKALVTAVNKADKDLKDTVDKLLKKASIAAGKDDERKKDLKAAKDDAKRIKQIEAQVTKTNVHPLFAFKGRGVKHFACFADPADMASVAKAGKLADGTPWAHDDGKSILIQKVTDNIHKYL